MDAAWRQRLITCAAVLGWAGLGIQLYLIFFARLSVGASLLGGLVSFFQLLHDPDQYAGGDGADLCRDSS